MRTQEGERAVAEAFAAGFRAGAEFVLSLASDPHGPLAEAAVLAAAVAALRAKDRDGYLGAAVGAGLRALEERARLLLPGELRSAWRTWEAKAMGGRPAGAAGTDGLPAAGRGTGQSGVSRQEVDRP